MAVGAGRDRRDRHFPWLPRLMRAFASPDPAREFRAGVRALPADRLGRGASRCLAAGAASARGDLRRFPRGRAGAGAPDLPGTAPGARPGDLSSLASASAVRSARCVGGTSGKAGARPARSRSRPAARRLVAVAGSRCCPPKSRTDTPGCRPPALCHNFGFDLKLALPFQRLTRVFP